MMRTMCGAMLLAGLAFGAAGAADPPKPVDKTKLAATDPSRADEDFAFQGEYLGRATNDEGVSQHAGLQVVALGDGKFQAVLLKGGLPGAGWNRRDREELTGERQGDVLTLRGPNHAANVSPAWATLADKSGQPLGSIPKIHRISATQDQSPPEGATVLFDGGSLEHWKDAKLSPEGLLEIGCTTKEPVGDFRLHLEFKTPYMPFARGQGRGNSGVYIQRRYEVQILDSFGLKGAANEAGGLYTLLPPAVNMCLPPLSWQTYDIEFHAARFEDGKKTENARLTVVHNGEVVQNHVSVPNKTGAGQPEGPQPLPILLQNHGNPVQFRNVWIVRE